MIPGAMETHEIEWRVLTAVGRALGRFALLRPGDRVAVGVSGGKDSLTSAMSVVGSEPA